MATGFDTERDTRAMGGMDAGARDAAAAIGVVITVDLARAIGIEDLWRPFDVGTLAAGLESWL